MNGELLHIKGEGVVCAITNQIIPTLNLAALCFVAYWGVNHYGNNPERMQVPAWVKDLISVVR